MIPSVGPVVNADFAASGFAARSAKNLSDLALKGVMLGTGFKGLQRASMRA